MVTQARFLLQLLVLSSCLGAAACFGGEPDEQRGQRLFKQTCAGCHGDQGEGSSDGYDQPLTGDASLAELTQVIVDTMPEEDPDACVGDDARDVAAYVFQQLYPRNATPDQPRLRLARLTAPQLRQSLSDLYRRHTSSPQHTSELGLNARYANRDRKNKQEFKRVDPLIHFDFGHDGPGQGIDAEDFSVQWTGSLKPDETGVYEIVVRCENSFIMYFGDYGREFINNHVQSAERTEFRKHVFLSAGSIHPLSIRLTQRKRKTAQPPVKISLSWRTPRGFEQIIPTRALLNLNSSPSFSLQTKLPADDRSYGYERGIAVDEQWNAATTKAALEFADALVAEAWPKYRRQHRKQPNENREILRSFLVGLVETAFRGELSQPLRDIYIEKHLSETDSDLEAIKRVVLITLKSPRFLYPSLDEGQTISQRAANRLALVLYDSLPMDKWLRDLVEQDRLQTEKQVRMAAKRMMGDWRVRAKTREMLHAWLHFEHFDDLHKSPELHPEFDKGLEADLRATLDHFMDEIVWSDRSDYRELFLASSSYTTPAMAEFYGEAWRPANAPSSSAGNPTLLSRSLPDERHLGVLSHPLLMSGLAYDETSSPIHRGVFLLRFVLGRTLRPPNEAFTPFSPDLHPELTTRERVALQTGEKSCQVCHAKINALGFTLENFDAVGRYQSHERRRAIDATGGYTTKQGEVVSFGGPRELSEFLANNADAQRSFVNRAFQHFVKQAPAAYWPGLEDELLAEFSKQEFNIQSLILEIAVAASHQHTPSLLTVNSN